MPARPRRRLVLAQAAGLVLIVVLAILATLRFEENVLTAIGQSRQMVRRASAQSEDIQELVEALKDAETGQRGYLLTGKATYLAPYRRGALAFDKAVGALDEMAAQAPAIRADAQILRDLANEKMAELSRTIALARDGDRQAALDLVQTDFGKATMDSVRERAALIRRQLAEDHTLRVEEVRSQEARASRAAVTTTMVCTVLLAVATLVLLGGRARLQWVQSELRAQTARLSATLAHLRDGVAVVDAGDALASWNQPFEALAALPPGRLRPGVPATKLIAEAWPQLAHEGLQGSGTAAVAEVTRDDRVFEIWRGDMPDAGHILVVSDITRRTRAEATARQAQKMHALGQLTGGVAHDFNNLLQVMSTNLELVSRKTTGETWLQALLGAAMAAIERAARLTRHLLAFARRQPLAPQSVNTARLLNGLEDMLRRSLGESVEVETVLAGSLWPIRVDPQQLESGILNLALNARDAMPQGGRLTIEASNAMLDHAYAARVGDVAPGQYVVIAITDSGSGMTPEQLQQALEPFYTTKSEGHGTGLGLPMVFGFAKQSGGHLQLYSEPGHGTTARLYLPRSLSEPGNQADDSDDTPQTASGELVLVVEDDPVVRAASCQALRGLGYRTSEADHAAAALTLLQDGLRPDLLFTDVVMPGVPDARSMAETARRMLPGLAVVYTSGYSENAVVHNGRLDPGVTLVSKPWRIGDLARTLRQALAAASRPPTRNGLRIVLVEDEALVRMTTADLLADMGHEVAEAGTGAEALKALQDGADLLITDLGLPDMDGLLLADRAVSAVAGLPVVIASGRDADTESRHIWLEKPYDLAGLRDAIARAVRVG